MSFPISLRRGLLAAVVLIVVLFVAWRLFHKTAAPTRAGGAAAPVRVVAASRRDMAIVERSLGTVIANTTVQLTARVQGTLDKATFREGQFVKKGELLFQIDARPFQAALDQAKAVAARDEAQLKNATRDKDRYFSLGDEGAISKQQRDASQTNVEMLAAGLAADRAALDIARLNLEFTQIRSPVDGKTGPLLVQPGNLVAGNGSAPLVTITQIRPVKISFTLPQSDLPRIQARQARQALTATIDAADAGGKALTAPVTFTSNAINAQSGTIELRAEFGNEDLALVPGALVNVTVKLADIADAVVLPRDAINDGPDGSFVYVVKKGKAIRQPVHVQFDDGKDVAIDGAVAAGDQVIYEGQLRVVPNGSVRVFGAT